MNESVISVTDNNKLKRRRKATVLICLALTLLLGVWITWILLGMAAELFWMGPAAFDRNHFDREKWLSYEKSNDKHIRKRMFHDLRKRHLKRGMSKKEVMHLLGKPTNQESITFNHYFGPSGLLIWASKRTASRTSAFYYDLGPDSIGIDTNELVIYFDSSGRVAHVGWSNT